MDINPYFQGLEQSLTMGGTPPVDLSASRDRTATSMSLQDALAALKLAGINTRGMMDKWAIQHDMEQREKDAKPSLFDFLSTGLTGIGAFRDYKGWRKMKNENDALYNPSFNPMKMSAPPGWKDM